MDVGDIAGVQALSLWSLTLVKLLGVVFSQQQPLQNTEGGEFCMFDTFKANCTGRGFILMLSAEFGRMRLGECINDDKVQTGCFTPVIDYIDRECSGRTTCEFPVQELRDISTGCSKETFQYLEAVYSCVDASVGNQPSCDRDKTTYLGGRSGYISSTALESNYFGTTQCPFTITVQPGQTIDFTLFDFTLKDAGAGSPATSGTSTEQSCPVEVVFTENNAPNPKNLCNGSLRERYLFSSRTHRVEVHFTTTSAITNVPLFFLSYEARGCPFYKAPLNTTVEIEDGYATVTCNFTGDAWTFHCDNTQWAIQEGNAVQNCTKELAAERNKTQDDEGDGFPWGILIAVGIGIALGTVVGLSLLGMVFLCRRCLCPEKPPLRPQPQESVRSQIAREHVPPMNELISEASLIAKHVPPSGVRRPGSVHYTPQQFGPISQTVAANIEYNPGGPHSLSMMHPDMRGRAAATLPRPRSVDSMSDHIYEAYKYRRADSGSMISESSSAEQLHTLGASTAFNTATLPLRVAPPPIAPKPNVSRQPSMHPSEASTSTSHPVASEETVLDSY